MRDFVSPASDPLQLGGLGFHMSGGRKAIKADADGGAEGSISRLLRGSWSSQETPSPFPEKEAETVGGQVACPRSREIVRTGFEL